MRNIPLPASPKSLNQSLPFNFIHKVLVWSHHFRTFIIVHCFNRETLPTEINLNLPTSRVVRVLDRGKPSLYGYAAHGYCPEFISLALAKWAEMHTANWSLFSRISRYKTLSLYVLRDTEREYSIFICLEHLMQYFKLREIIISI